MDSKISHLSYPILDRFAAQADAVAAVAAAAAANNKFIAADEVHKLIITSRQRISLLWVPVQTITDDLQHNGARLTDAGLLAWLFARTRGLMRLRHRLHAYGYPPAVARYNLDSEGAHGFLRSRTLKMQRRCRLHKNMSRMTYNLFRNDPFDALWNRIFIKEEKSHTRRKKN